MVMVSFIKAKELYNQGKFQEAYEAYIQLGRIFGQKYCSISVRYDPKKS